MAKKAKKARRKRVSARHQVKRLDRPFEELETGPAEEISFFVRCGSFSSAISPAISKPK